MTSTKFLYPSIFFIALLTSCVNFSNETQKKTQQSVEDTEQSFTRHIELDGQVNFRDLGNYINESNFTIKPKMVYRSGHFAKLSDDDLDKMEELGIKTVVSFLTPNEIKSGGEDRLPEGVNRVYLGIEGQGNEVDDLIAARRTGDFSAIPSDFNFQIHRILPETGKAQYDSLFHLLADSLNYPLVFHCSHGIHRTGTASAILLSLLGVPWNTVSDDYLLSNKYRHEESSMRIHYLDSIARVKNPDLDHETNLLYIQEFYTLSPEYIKGTQDHILEEYGSFEKYAHNSGISSREIDKIKRILLQ